MKPKLPVSYPYKPRIWVSLLGFVFFGVCTYFLLLTAQTNDRGLELILFKRIISFSFTLEEATLFYWVLSGLSGAMTLIGLYCVYEGLTSKARLNLSERELHLPPNKLKRRKAIVVPYAEILALEIQEANKIRLLKIICEKKTVHISSSLLPKKAVIDEIFDLLKPKLGHAQ